MRRLRFLAAWVWWAAATLAIVPGPAGAADPAATGAVSPAAADTIWVDGEFSPAVVKLGEPLTLRVRLESPAPGARLMGPPAPLSVGDLDVLKSQELVTGQDSLGWELSLALFRTGDLTLPALPFRLETAGGPVPVVVRPYRLSVTPTVEPDSAATAQIQDIKGPLTQPLQWRWMRVGIAAAVLVLLAVGTWWWRRRRALREAEAIPVELRLPPEVIAMRELDELEREALPGRGQLKEHYARLSLIVRAYMERRFRLPAVESTTYEIETSLQDTRVLDAERSREVLTLLDDADLVKFAKFHPADGAPADALGRARRWVEVTKSLARPEAPTTAGDGEDGGGGTTIRSLAPPESMTAGDRGDPDTEASAAHNGGGD